MVTIVDQCEPVLLEYITEQPLCSNTRQWKLLEAFLGLSPSNLLRDHDITVSVVKRICDLVSETVLVSNATDSKNGKDLLELLARMDKTVIEVCTILYHSCILTSLCVCHRKQQICWRILLLTYSSGVCLPLRWTQPVSESCGLSTCWAFIAHLLLMFVSY